jgi:hypothetical protein
MGQGLQAVFSFGGEHLSLSELAMWNLRAELAIGLSINTIDYRGFLVPALSNADEFRFVRNILD